MEECKKIFFVIGYLGGQGWGGAHRMVCVLANYFARIGHDVTVIVWKDSTIDYPLDDMVKIQWMHCKINKEIDVIKPCLMTRKILKQHNGAYLIAFMSKMATYSRLFTVGLDIKVIGSERTDPQKEPRKKIYRLVRNIAFCFLDKIVYQTEDAMNYFPKMAQKKGCVIPNPITPGLPLPFDGERRKEFVAFCRIDKQKNLPMMIDAFIEAHKKHPDYNLRIYGTGNDENKIKKYIKDHKAENYILMEGFSDNVHDNIVDAYAFLSSSNYEGLSNSMLEALSIGLPCICTDCPIGGAHMIIENGVNGILVPVGDRNTLSREICRLIENKDLCKKISVEARKVRDKLSENIICDKWNQLLSSL